MFQQLRRYFIKEKPIEQPQTVEDVIPTNIKFKVVVVEFFDNINNNNGSQLSALLNQFEGLDVSCLIPDFDQSFLNFESRSFFDLIEKGQTLLKQTKADVLVWGYRETGRIRLNFQTPRQYENEEQSFVCLLDSMYIPADAFALENIFPQSLLNLLAGTIISAVNRSETPYKIYKKFLLKKIIRQISQIESVKPLGLEYMPYLLNQLGLIYMSVAAENKNENDYKTITNLFETALKHRSQILQPTHLGCIHLHLGQLNDSASVYMGKHLATYFRLAIHHYQHAQKHFGKYTYPYDYGFICYKLSALYYNFWKRSEDLQALRDSIFQLRESERIFTQALFPEFWGHLQGNLGYLLHNLGHLTESTEICHLSVNAYRNQQKIVTEKHQPLHWAQIQEKIAEVYYLEGKMSANAAAFQESLACYHDALYIFETAKKENATLLVKTGIAKVMQNLNNLSATEEDEEEII